MSHYTVTQTLDLGVAGEIDCEVSFNYSFGRPEVHTLPNGDPGYPADPDEIDIIEVTTPDGIILTDLVRSWLEDSEVFAEAASEEVIAANSPPEE